MAKKIIFFLFFIKYLCCHNVIGQVTIDTVTIQEKKYIHHHLVADHNTQNKDFFTSTEFLENITSGQIQQNTPGGLQTFLHHGLGNRHLSVLWQGINIQSVINGSYDLSLIPIDLMSNVSFYSTGNPALQGNNSFAGAIDIQNDNQMITNNKIFASIGSLQNYLVGLNLNKKMKKVRISLGGDLAYDKNVFSYKYNGVTDKRTPTNLFKQNLLFDITWFTSKNQVLKANVWFQHANRHIPVSVSSAPTDQRQTDQNLRTQISHLYYFRNKKLETSISYMNEKLNFFTPAIRSLSTVNSVIYTSQLSETKSQKWFTGVTFRRDGASPNFYTSFKTRNTLLLSGAYKMNWSKNLTTNLSLRQDHVDKKWMPLSWNVHTAYRNTTLTISGNYNLPGFNDLYWPVGGNINLKTEKSTQAELKTEINSDNWVFRLATYAHVVHDWIQWLPQSNGLFSPENQKKVFSRGLDFSVTKKVPFNNFIFEPIIQCNLNKTTAIDHYFDPTLIGKQLIYVPKLKAKIALNAKFKNQQALLSYDFTGTRYDVPDQSMQLRPIHLLHLSYQINRNNWNYILQFNNVLDLPYQVTRFYPMPGINLSLKVIHNIL
ncbi:MAG: TonB-dependent receptor [Saprospiraceae bacterium]|nr:TonB-dependent receptor [Saprospiraceae bacterium]